MSRLVMSTTTTRLAAVALLVFACSLYAIGSQWPAFSHIAHPVAFAGMRGVEGALLFNAMVFVLPGLLIALVALRLRAALPDDARWQSRIGATLLLLSGVAFLSQGILSLDPDNLDAGASRWHASAWTVWWVAFAVGAVLHARTSMRQHLVAVVAVLVVLAMSMLAGDRVPPGVAQRIAFATWFAWFWYAAAGAVSRDGVSARG